MTEHQDEMSQTPEHPGGEATTPPKTIEADKSKWWKLFVPTRSFFFTPLIIDINILLFLAMTIMSGSFEALFSPDKEMLIKWGANYKPSILHGEWWRLFTSIFEHIGIFHLVMNMYALLFVGIFLEPILGKARYITVYIVTGVMGGISSLWWHDDHSVGAGASGAIFGLYGVFLALLTTNFIEKNARKALLGSILIFVVYNLVYGMKKGIDNAAHIGGLSSGLIAGYIYFLSFRSKQEMYKWVGIAVVLAAGAITCFAILPKINDPYGEYLRVMHKVSENEEQALQYFHLPDSTTDEKRISYLRDSTLPAWSRASSELSKLENVQMPGERAKRRDLISEYVRYRFRVAERTMEGLNEKTNMYDGEINNLNRKINSLLAQLNAPSK
jgi:rhomboid protease GluP